MGTREELLSLPRDRLVELVLKLAEDVEALRHQIADRDERIRRLEEALEAERRKGKRQAAPFSKGAPKPDPKTPGRKPGDSYGRQAVRERPRRVDRTIHVPCPLFCGRCGGDVRLAGRGEQFVVDIPPIRPTTTRFVVQLGKCRQCGCRVQGRHPEQVSDALEVGAVQLGGNAVTLAAWLNKVVGVTWGKVSRLFAEVFGLTVARSSLCRAALRLARKARPTYDSLVEQIRGSPVVYPDETGWREAGRNRWLWAFATPTETVYSIAVGRGFPEAAAILGSSYRGLIGCDGWAPYQSFEEALRQTCLAHLLRRAHELLETATRGAVRFPRAVRALLLDALALRDASTTLTARAFARRLDELDLRADRLLAARLTDGANRRFAKHLRNHRYELFLFLYHPEIEATNWPAEQAIRPAVVNRKISGGNRSPRGCEAQAILSSIFRTFDQRHRSPFSPIARLFRSAEPFAVLQPVTP